jgi:hypothetical protein
MSEKIFLLTTSFNQEVSSQDFNKLKVYAEELITSQILKFQSVTGPSSFFEVKQECEQDNLFQARIIETRKNTVWANYDQVVFTVNIKSVKVI